MKNTFLELKETVFKGAQEKNIKLTDTYLDRINYELSIIMANGFSDYFLLYSRIIGICNKLNILRSYGRNTALNSLVNYCLDITKLDPVEYNLIFERFMLAPQKQLPDIDIDIPCGFKDLVITNFKANFPEYFVYSIAFNPKCESGYDDIILDGLQLKKHPCGFIFTTEIIVENTFIVNGHDHYFVKNTSTDPFYAKKVDLVEFGYLNKIQKIIDIIGDDYHPYKLPLSDSKVFKFLSSGDLENVFQVDKEPLPELLAKFDISSIQDLALFKALSQRSIAFNVPRSISYKQDIKKLPLLSSATLNSVLSETQFLLVYQETFLQLCHLITGMDYDEAESFRKVITKFNVLPENIALFKSAFKEKAILANVLSEDEVELILETIVATYFNALPKGHILSYTIISYWGAYYKTYFKDVFRNICNDLSPNKNN